MKPRTKLHREIIGFTDYVKDLEHDKDFKNWAFKTCFEHKGFATKSKVLCLDCGETFSPTLVSRKKATCPNCKTKIAVTDSRCTTDKQTNWFATAEIIGEFQVIRNFEINANYKKFRKVTVNIQEILEYWVHPHKKLVMFGKSHVLNHFADCWTGPMEIRQENTKSWQPNKYDIYPRFYHPKAQFKADYVKYGIDVNLKGISFLEAIKTVPFYPKSETLLKAKQYAMLGHYTSNSGSIERYWNSVKICIRNNYIVTDASMYYDYLQLLEYFHKDLQNAFYVCPKNMKKEHDRLSNKKREILRTIELQRDREKAIIRQQNLEKAMKEYIDRFKEFLNLNFSNKKITITPLQSVDEFKIEGDELKHCLFTNEYYLRENSLIFSARVNNKRTETIEFNLTNFKIEQSRGLNNLPTKYHEQIIQLINKNVPKIIETYNKIAS